MTISQIMTAAWTMYREAGCSTKYEFSIALKAAWAQAKSPSMTMAEYLMANGGKRWTKGDKDRVYLNNDVAERVFGLETYCSKSGSISSAFFHGESISNSKGGKLGAYLTSKAYYDVADGSFCFSSFSGVDGDHKDDVAATVAALRKKYVA